MYIYNVFKVQWFHAYSKKTDLYLIWLSSTKWLKPLNTQVLDINNMGGIF